MKNIRFVAFVLMITTLLTSLSFSISANNLITDSDEITLFPALSLSFVEDNISSLIDISELQRIAQRRNINFVPQDYDVKQLTDFNGYTYYIVEFSPIGYAIYDNRFTHILEFNAKAISPYHDRTEELFYAGAGEYYIKSNTLDDVYIHPISGYSFADDTDTELYFKEQSSNISSAVNLKATSILSIDSNASQINATASTSYASLSKYSVITSVDTTNFNVCGNCGYVAGSLIVWYHYKVLGWTDFVPGGTITSALARDIQGDRGPATYGPDLQEALSAWSYSHGAVEEGGWQETLPALLDVLPTASKIYNLIDDDRPVALLGLTPPQSDLDPSGTNSLNNISGTTGSVEHVITITGVDKVTNSIIDVDYYYYAHFGWTPSYNDIYISDSSLTKGAIVYY
ncbi:MAG: hypothetical protein E7516_10480 [Ruminococcaceae bacterium]|nr:hypothetical protein [Oscillospiraceae bacterium]